MNNVMDEYEQMHRLEAEAKRQEAEIRRLRAIIAQQDEEMEVLEKRVLDLEAASFADSCEREIDLARWKDGIAASVGHDLGGVADTLYKAIEAAKRGDGVIGTLYEAHMGLLSIIGDLMTFKPDAGEGI